MTPEGLADWDRVVGELAAVAPRHPPGTRNAYHSYSFGWILGELVRQTDAQDRSFARFVQEELCGPLGADAFWFGVPADVEARVAKLDYPAPPPAPPADAEVHHAVPAALALNPEVYNRAEVHRACIPATGAVADARSLARLFAIWAGSGASGDVRLLPSDAVHACLAPRPDADAPDLTYGMRLPVGVGGLWIEAPVVAPGRRVLAHPGAGSSVAWAELDLGLSVAICHNRMTATPPRSFGAIAEAVRAIAFAARG
jgi:CubicO group peptidase (beta-lactamase class C family)